MAIEWQDCAPAPPVRMEVGPPNKTSRHRRRVEPRTVCVDRPRDVIPQVPGADALPLSPAFSGDDEMGRSDRWQHRGQDEKRPRLTPSEEAERKARRKARVLGFRFRV